MTTIGYATLQIVPSLRGVSDSINKQLAAMPDLGTAAGKQLGANIAAAASGSGKKIGKDLEAGVADGAEGAAGQVKTRLSERLGAQVGSVVGKGIGAGIKLGIAGGAAAAAVAVGGIGIALSKGFDRLKSIDQAKFKLQALGNSAADVQTIMDNALASVKGTAFGLQDAATAAASAVAAGIKPGQDLTKYLKEVGDAAAVAGTNFTDMGSIFNKIQTSNKAYTDDLQQLSDRGLPIFQWLQQEYGVTADKLSDMVQKGEVDSAHFQDAINKNIGGAAQKMGQSFDGAVDNLEASVARLGANFITSLLGGDPNNALQGPTDAITNLTTKFDEIGVWVNAHSAEIHGFFEDVKTVAIEVGGAVRDIGTWLVQNKGFAETFAAVFVGWKVVSALGDAAGAARGVATALGLIGPAAATAGAEGAAGLAPFAAALGPIAAAIAAITAGGALGGKLFDNAVKDAGGPNTAAGKNAINQEFSPGFGIPGAATSPVFAATPDIPGGGGRGAQRARRGAAPAPLPPNAYDPFKLLPGHVAGGSISGPGTGISDSILARVSNGEFIVNADATRKSLPLLEIINSGKLPGFAGGGLVAGDEQLRKIIMERFGISDIGGYRPADQYGEHSTGRALDVMVGANKSKGDAVKDFALSNASAIDLKWVIWRQHLYYPGGGGYDMPDRGSPTQNHMDHVHIFSGTGITNGLRGSLAGGPGVGIAAGVGVPAGGPGAEDTSSSDQTAAPSSSGGGVSLASSFSGLSSFGLDGLGSGIGTTSSGSDLSLFGKAAGSAVSGQISSALGVFGVNDSPGWLKAASQLIGGVKVSDKNGNSLFDGSNLFGGGHSAAPLSATPTSTGTPPPDGTVHGSRAGQAPGPQTVYNIRTATVEDAFLAAQRKQNERVAAKLSVF